MKYVFCSVFDKGFLNRGLALYHSVAKQCPEPFRHFMLCLDDEAYQILKELNLPGIVPVSLAEFETEELKAVRKTRNFAEYCWTLSAVSTAYTLERNPDAETVAYLDADLFFYNSIAPIYDAFEGHSTLIIPHNVAGYQKEREGKVGKYNVGMLIFRNDVDGRACLSWWRDRCVEWCYDKPEPTRYGDQKYLDYFEEKFKGVYVLPFKGACLARWNIATYKGKFSIKNGVLMVEDEPVYFFHFSMFKLYYPPSSWLPWSPPSLYTLPSSERELLYRRYANALYAAMEEIRRIRPGFTFGTLPRPLWYMQASTNLFFTAKQFIKHAISR